MTNLASRNQLDDSFALSDEFFKDDKYLAANGYGMEKLIYGMQTQLAQRSDEFITNEVPHLIYCISG